MNKEREEKLAAALTAETTELIPYLPYLLQDFWELGSSPEEIIELLNNNLESLENLNILDLACGKGPVSVMLAKKLGAKVKGIDIMVEFIDEAIEKAKEHGVEQLCTFAVDDINVSVENEKEYDIVVLSAVGDVLGNAHETLNKLKKTINNGGYIILDEAYLREGFSNTEVGYRSYEYLTYKEWIQVFEKERVQLIDSISFLEYEKEDIEMEAIIKRANELKELHPDKKALFDSYIKSQENEYKDLENTVVGITWLLKK